MEPLVETFEDIFIRLYHWRMVIAWYLPVLVFAGLLIAQGWQTHKRNLGKVGRSKGSESFHRRSPRLH